MQAHISGNRSLVEQHLQGVLEALSEGQPTAFELVTLTHGERLSQQNGQWLLSQTLGYLTHLESVGRARRIAGEPERWTA